MSANLGVVVGGDDAISTMSVVASGDNELTVFDDLVGVEVINVEGGSSLELIDGSGANFNSLVELNVGGYDGDLTINISGTSGALAAGNGTPNLETVVAGSGDNDVTMAAIHFAESGSGSLQTVSLGGGDNVLRLTDNVGGGTFVDGSGTGPGGIFVGDEVEDLDFTSGRGHASPRAHAFQRRCSCRSCVSIREGQLTRLAPVSRGCILPVSSIGARPCLILRLKLTSSKRC